VAVFLVESVGILLTNIVFFFGTHNVSFMRQLFVILLQILAKIIFCFRSTKDVGHNSILECQQVLNRYWVVAFISQASSGRNRPLYRQRHLSNIFRLPIPNPIPNPKP